MNNRWIWLERILFLIGLIILMHPVLSSRYYFTVDGPSHVYNALLLKELLISSSSAEFLWEINPLPVPNWTGHCLLALFLFFLEPPEALKALHLLCILGLPMAYRLLVALQSSGPYWTSLLIFPFAMHGPFGMGYYNFTLAIPLMLLVLWQWRRIDRGHQGTLHWVALGALMLLLYFSHLMPFLFVLLWLGVLLAVKSFQEIRSEKGLAEATIKRILGSALALAPGIVLLAIYLSGSPDPSSFVEIPKNRIEQVWKPFVMFERMPELVLYGGAILCCSGVYLNQFFTTGLIRRIPDGSANATFLLLGVTLLLCMPDGFGKGSDVLFRLSVLLHVSFLAILPVIGGSPWTGALVVMITLGITAGQQIVREPELTNRTHRLRDCTLAVVSIPEETEATYIAFDWWDAHLPELGFAQRRTLDHSNYELTNSHFPLRWSTETMRSRAMLPTDTLDVVRAWANAPGNMIRNADYLVLMNYPKDEEQWTLRNIVEEQLKGTHREFSKQSTCKILQRIQ